MFASIFVVYFWEYNVTRDHRGKPCFRFSGYRICYLFNCGKSTNSRTDRIRSTELDCPCRMDKCCVKCREVFQGIYIRFNLDVVRTPSCFRF